MDRKIRLLNQNMEIGYCGPASLFKYRPFDEYTFDMLENNYLFLCAAENLDDKSECDTTIDIKRCIDEVTNNARIEVINQIIEIIKPYMSKENYEKTKLIINDISRKDGTVRSKFLLDIIPKIEELVPNVDITPFANWLASVPEKLDNPNVKPQLERLIKIGYNAKKLLGICSLCESHDVEEMWNGYYAGNETGYCIEYDVSNYEYNKSIYPVIYNNDRDTDIITQLVVNFINQIIFEISNGNIMTDKSQYLRLFLTKNTEWEYQKEWRLIGEANKKVVAPKIINIYLGKNVKEEHRKNMMVYCKKRGINLIQR